MVTTPGEMVTVEVPCQEYGFKGWNRVKKIIEVKGGGLS